MVGCVQRSQPTFHSVTVFVGALLQNTLAGFPGARCAFLTRATLLLRDWDGGRLAAFTVPPGETESRACRA
jgi:hypothetical protein